MINHVKSAFSYIKEKKSLKDPVFIIKSFFFLLLSALFLFLVAEIIIRQYYLQIDLFIVHWITSVETQKIIQVFIWITELGNAHIVLPFLFLTAIILWILKRTLLVIPLLISIISSTALTYLGKFLVHRTRPVEAILLEHTYSFPSGHATIAFSFYGFIFYLLICHVNSFNKQLIIIFSGTGFILFLGLSRIVLKVHYFSDVMMEVYCDLMWLLLVVHVHTTDLVQWEVQHQEYCLG